MYGLLRYQEKCRYKPRRLMKIESRALRQGRTAISKLHLILCSVYHFALITKSDVDDGNFGKCGESGMEDAKNVLDVAECLIDLCLCLVASNSETDFKSLSRVV